MTNKNFARDRPYFWKRTLQLKADETKKERKENPIDVHRPLCYDVLVLYLVDLEECYDQSCYEGSGQEGIEVVSEVLKVEKKFCKGLPLFDERGRLNLGTSEVQNTNKTRLGKSRTKLDLTQCPQRQQGTFHLIGY